MIQTAFHSYYTDHLNNIIGSSFSMSQTTQCFPYMSHINTTISLLWTCFKPLAMFFWKNSATYAVGLTSLYLQYRINLKPIRKNNKMKCMKQASTHLILVLSVVLIWAIITVITVAEEKYFPPCLTPFTGAGIPCLHPA